MNRINYISKYLRIPLLFLAFVIFIGTFWTINPFYTELNLHVYQAKAFLQGHLDLPQHYWDTAIYKGRFYSPYPPFPALILLPIVAIFGVTATNVTLVSVALSVLNIVLLTCILKRLDIKSKFIPWIVASFFFGTAYWLCVCWSNGVWYYAQIVAVTCIFLAINEAFGKGRGFLAGLFLGLAFLSRQLYVYSIFFIGVALWKNSYYNIHKQNFSNILRFLTGFGFCIGIYLLFNWMRFGNPFDTGYSYLSLTGFFKARVERFGLFHPAYLPFNFLNMFFQGFHIEFAPPTYLRPIKTDPFGTSITFASPFVFIAFLAKWNKSLLWAAWISISLSLVHMLFYYANGLDQLNAQRYSLDFLPILILLVAIGTKRVTENLWKAAIMYSIILNVLALFCIPLIGKITT